MNKKVDDLGAAAYLLMHGWKPKGKNGKAVVFQVEESESDEFDQVHMDYLRSEFHRFDSCLMSLKKMNHYVSEN